MIMIIYLRLARGTNGAADDAGKSRTDDLRLCEGILLGRAILIQCWCAFLLFLLLCLVVLLLRGRLLGG